MVKTIKVVDGKGIETIVDVTDDTFAVIAGLDTLKQAIHELIAVMRRPK